MSESLWPDVTIHDDGIASHPPSHLASGPHQTRDASRARLDPENHTIRHHRVFQKNATFPGFRVRVLSPTRHALASRSRCRCATCLAACRVPCDQRTSALHASIDANLDSELESSAECTATTAPAVDQSSIRGNLDRSFHLILQAELD